MDFFLSFTLFSPLQELLEEAFPKQSDQAGQTFHIFAKMRTSLLYIAANLALASAQVLFIPIFWSMLMFNLTVDSWIAKLFQVQQIMQAISAAQEYGPQAIQYAQEYGPQAISTWQNYGPQAIQYAQEYGPQAISYAQNYGPQAIQYAQEYGPQAIQAWQQYGNQLPEAITFAQQNAQYIPQVMIKQYGTMMSL